MSKEAMALAVSPAQQLRGSVELPSDKSIAHRVAMLASLAHGKVRVSRYLEGRDTLLTLTALRRVGVGIHRTGSELVIRGRGLDGFEESPHPLFVGRSATTMRFLAGLLSPDPILTILTGTVRTNNRPMARVVTPLQRMGARIAGRNGNTTGPLVIVGGGLDGVRHRLDVPSGEAKTALMLAALRAKGETVIESPRPSRDHTERLLIAMARS